MTTFQDPPPQSRRSARQNERGEQPEAPAEFGQFPSSVPASEPFLGEQAAQQAPSATGRRARPNAEPGQYEVPPEPLNYTTQGRAPAAPSPQGDASPQVPPAGYSASSAAGGPFRVRDFSPEGGGRRAAAAPLVEPNAYSGNPPGASDLDYRTQAAPTPYVPPAPVAEPTTHQTQSRRQIRQREMDAEAAATTTGSAAYGIPRQDAPPPSVVTAPPSLQTAPPPPPQSLQTAPPPTQQGQPSTHSNGTTEFDALTRNGQLAPPNANQRVSDPSTPAFQQPDLAPEVEQTGGWVAPAGHWSRQADLDDETQPWENTITREVGGGNVATTTSALVLPEIPRADPFATALNSTGEVLLTGSIDLPRSLGSTGTDSRHYDDPSVDRMFDTQDAEFTGTDSAPVRAIRAVSTHNSARGVIHANKPHGNRLIVVVFVATAVLAVGVVGMLIASLAFGLF